MLKKMKRNWFYVAALIVLMACTDTADADRENETDTVSAGNPAVVHPPTETITDSTKIVNDSVIVPDTAR